MSNPAYGLFASYSALRGALKAPGDEVSVRAEDLRVMLDSHDAARQESAKASGVAANSHIRALEAERIARDLRDKLKAVIEAVRVREPDIEKRWPALADVFSSALAMTKETT